MKKIIFVLLIIASLAVNAQEKKEEPKFGINFSGFVKTDIFRDSRQTVNIREGHFLLYPSDISKDANDEDINARANFNMLSIQSRLKGSITGPDAFGAKTSGVLEADFFGNEVANVFSDLNGFRLRHAFCKLTWTKTELLVGQYWHPMFVAESFPEVISFNTGAPFQPFSRNPQIRFTYKMGKTLKVFATAFTQRDFTGTGPAGASSSYLRNSSIPNLNLQFQFVPDSTEHLFGAGVDYKVIIPELSTTKGVNKYVADQSLASLSALAYAKLKLKPVTIKLQSVLAQNAYDMVMLGGYAVRDVIDTATGAREFINLKTGSVWGEVLTNGKKIKVGAFIGYTKNMGANDSIKTTTFCARGQNISYLYRVAPRIVFISGKMTIAVEGEYTFAMYGKENGNGEGLVTNGRAVTNTRALLAFIYNF